MGLTQEDVIRAYEAPFDLQAIVMKYRCDRDKEVFPSLRIPYFLIFYCPSWHKEKLRMMTKKKNETV